MSTAKGKVGPAPSGGTNVTPRGGAGAAGRGKTGTLPVKQPPVQTVVEDRDPKGINKHVKVQFADVLAEVGPETHPARSTDCTWRNSHSCFTCWKNCLYKLYTLFCGVCLACGYGFHISLYAFPVIWCITPFTKKLKFCLVDCLGRFIRICADCCVGAVCESIGEVFWAFRGHKKGPLLPQQRGNNKVSFNDKVKSRTIPRNTNAGARPTAKVAPAPPGNKPATRR